MSLLTYHRTWIEIDSQAFAHNIAQLKRLVPDVVTFGVVVKSNAYGHGMVPIAQLCQANVLVDWLLVSEIDEALALRVAGVLKPILVMAYSFGDLVTAIQQDIIFTVWDESSVAAIHSAAQQVGKIAQVHIKVDTGMSRLGLLPEAVVLFLHTIARYAQVQVQGIFTHLADTNNFDQSFSIMQLARFDALLLEIRDAGIVLPVSHALASGSLLFSQKYAGVRIGTSVYGFWKSEIQQKRFMAVLPDITLKPVLTWKTHVLQVKDIAAGSCVGYNCAYIAQKNMRIAILPVGYFDGYPRALSNKSCVIVREKQLPVIGMVSMTLIVIDATLCPAIAIGDEVVLLGKYPGITAVDLAYEAGTVGNEVITRISTEISRIIV